MTRNWFILAAIAALGLPIVTHAAASRTWWVFNFEKNVCELATSDSATPEAFHLRLHRLGLADEIDVRKDSNRNVLMVEISTRLPGDAHEMSAHFFLSEEQCRAFATEPTTPNPQDLR